MIDDIFSKDTRLTSSEGLELKLNDDKKSYTVVGIGSCNKDNIVIDSFDNLPITHICKRAFAECKDIVSVTLGESVTNIGNRAFERCEGLKVVSFSSGNLKICEYAFYECKEINSVYAPDLVSWCNIEFENSCSSPLAYAKKWYIGENVITDLTIPDEIGAIKDYTFFNATTIKSVTFHENVSSIGISAFSQCSALTEITIPSCVKSIGDNAFHLCERLKKINLSQGLKTIGKYAFSGCESITEIYLPNTTQEIDNYAFATCKNLMTANICEGLLKLGEGVFQGCDELTYYVTNDARYLGNDENSFLILVDIKDKEMRNFKLNDKTRFIHNGAFTFCERLKSIQIPSAVLGIGARAFYGCKRLEKVKLKNGILSIGMQAFEGCESIESLEIPDTVSFIGTYLFNGCANLTKVIIGDGIEELPVGIFDNCKSLEIVQLGRGMIEFSNRTFRSCKGLKSVKFKNPDGWWRDIGKFSFTEKVIAPYNVKSPSKNAENILNYPNGRFYTDEAISRAIKFTPSF